MKKINVDEVDLLRLKNFFPTTKDEEMIQKLKIIYKLKE